MAEQVIGAVVGTYRSRAGELARGAAVMAGAGLLVLAVAVPFLIVVEDRAGKTRQTGGDPLMLPIIVVMLGFGLLLIGSVVGVRVRRHRDEVFQLHEFGLTHSRGGAERRLLWADIASVSTKPRSENALSRWSGGDFCVVLESTSGPSLAITGLTTDARDLVQAVRAATGR